jgi:hypothetical protein
MFESGPMQPLRLFALVCLFLVGLSQAAPAADPYAAFVTGLRSHCAKPPAARCAVAVNRFLDRNFNGRIELLELKQARRRARIALRTKQAPLTALERNLTAVGLMILKYAGIEQVFANFDADGDGGIDSKELFADFRMDRRPFRAIVVDPKAANWKSFAQRFGKVGFLITDLVSPKAKPQPKPQAQPKPQPKSQPKR